MLKRVLVMSLFCMILLNSASFVVAVGEFEGADGQFIGNSIYGYFSNFAEEKLNYLKGVNMGGKCAYYEGPNAPCTPEGGSFLLPGGDDLQSYYYNDIAAAMTPYNDALAQLRLEKKERDAACDDLIGWQGDVWYSAQDCFDEVSNEYDYGKIYNKEAEQYKVRKSFFKTINEQITKRYLTGERETGALQSLEVAFPGYNSCMDTCDEPFGAAKKSSSYCDNICMAKYQETLMKDFDKYRKEELSLPESQTGAQTGPLSDVSSGEQTTNPSEDDSTSDTPASLGQKIAGFLLLGGYMAGAIFAIYYLFKWVIKLLNKIKAYFSKKSK